MQRDGKWLKTQMYSYIAHTQTGSLARLTWCLVEGWHLGRPMEVQGKTELCSFHERAGGTAAIVVLMRGLTYAQPTKGRQLFIINPLPKGHIWDPIGQVESVHVHYLVSALGPCPRPLTQLGAILTDGLLAPDYRPQKHFCNGRLALAVGEILDGGR